MLTDIELKLLRLALDRAAPDGEYSTAAIMFIKKLRERNATADGLFSRAGYELPLIEQTLTVGITQAIRS